MDDRDRELTGLADRVIRPTGPGTGGLGERGLRQIPFASPAFRGTPAFRSRSDAGLRLTSVGWVSGRPKVRALASSNRQPPAPRPLLIGYVLYDDFSEELHEFIERYKFLLDEATYDVVLLVAVGNPSESGPLYLALRDDALRQKDEAGEKTYWTKLKRVRADYLRKDEVRKLRQELEVSGDDVPCIAFYRGRPGGPRALVKIDPIRLATKDAQRELARTLVDFFRSGEIERLSREHRTGTEFIRKFETTINARLASHPETGRVPAGSSSFKLALRKIEEGRNNWGYVARLIGTDRFDVVNRKIGAREFFFLSLLFESKFKHEDGRGIMTAISEEKAVEALKEWSEKGYLRFSGIDQANPTHRVQKMWHEFVRQMGKEKNLIGMFTVVKDCNGQKLFAVRLRPDEIANYVPSTSALVAKETTG